MITEKRTLPIGIEYDGKIHRDLEISPRRVAHMIDALEDAQSQKNDHHYNVAMLACQIIKLGDIPKEAITASLLRDMYEQDFNVLTEAAETARTRVEGFRPDPAERHTKDAGAAPESPAEGDIKPPATEV